MHQTEVLASPSAVLKALYRVAESGELTELLTHPPRVERLAFQSQGRLSAEQIKQLIQDYQDDKGSVYDLAEKYGIHRQTVALHLRARGIELGNTSLSPDEIARVRELHEAGLSANRIGRRMGRDPKTVRAALQS